MRMYIHVCTADGNVYACMYRDGDVDEDYPADYNIDDEEDAAHDGLVPGRWVQGTGVQGYRGVIMQTTKKTLPTMDWSLVGGYRVQGGDDADDGPWCVLPDDLTGYRVQGTGYRVHRVHRVRLLHTPYCIPIVGKPIRPREYDLARDHLRPRLASQHLSEDRQRIRRA